MIKSINVNGLRRWVAERLGAETANVAVVQDYARDGWTVTVFVGRDAIERIPCQTVDDSLYYGADLMHAPKAAAIAKVNRMLNWTVTHNGRNYEAHAVDAAVSKQAFGFGPEANPFAVPESQATIDELRARLCERQGEVDRLKGEVDRMHGVCNEYEEMIISLNKRAAHDRQCYCEQAKYIKELQDKLAVYVCIEREGKRTPIKQWLEPSPGKTALADVPGPKPRLLVHCEGDWEP